MNVDPLELKKFADLAHRWWDKNSEFKPLHEINPLRLDHEIGSLEVGKAADIVAVDLSSVETLPCYDVASHLVYVAGREHVSHVWIAGKLLIENRVAMHLDLDGIRAKAQSWRDKIAMRNSS